MVKHSTAEMEQSPETGKTKRFNLQFISVIILFAMALFCFALITDEIVLKHENGFDQSISNAILPIVSPSVTKLMIDVTFFGSTTFLFPAYIVLILYYLFRKNNRLALDVTMIGLSSTGILFLFKEVFQRHRPLEPLINNVAGFSFPSCDSFSSFTFFGLLIYITWKTGIHIFWKIIITFFLFLFAATIAFSRVYLRVHYPSDVVAGFCLSVVWLITVLWILHKANRGIASAKK